MSNQSIFTFFCLNSFTSVWNQAPCEVTCVISFNTMPLCTFGSRCVGNVVMVSGMCSIIILYIVLPQNIIYYNLLLLCFCVIIMLCLSYILLRLNSPISD
jgi:hypothetical protein